MAAEWFYQIMGEQFGPIEPAELRRLAVGGTVSRDTLIRKGADGRWMLAEDVLGVFPWSNAAVQSSGSRQTAKPSPSPPLVTPPQRPKGQFAQPPGAGSISAAQPLDTAPEKPDRIHPLTWAAVIAGAGTVLLLLWALVFRGDSVPRQEAELPAAKDAPRQNAGVDQPASKSALDPVALYASCRSAVATVLIKDDGGLDAGQGSGFFIGQEWIGRHDARYVQDVAPKDPKVGYLLTNYHVVRSAASAEIRLDDNGAGLWGLIPDVVMENEELDLALLRVIVYPPVQVKPAGDAFSCDWAALKSKAPWYLTGIRTLAITQGADPAIGTKVYAIGSPRGLDATLSEGIVSGSRPASEASARLQFTAPVSPGSSGGPLLDSSGQVVGVVTALRWGGQNLNFAVPTSQVRGFLNGKWTSRELWRGASIKEEEEAAYRSASFATRAKSRGKAEMAGVESLLQARKQVEGAGDIEVDMPKYREALKTLAAIVPSSCGEFEYLLHYAMAEALSRHAFDARLRTKVAPNVSLREDWERFMNQSPDKQAAIRHLKQAIHLKPKFSPAYDSLWGAYTSCGQHTEALLVADRLVQLVPRCSKAYAHRGASFADLGQLDSALKNYRLAVEFSPSAPSHYFAMAEVYSELRLYDKAVESYQTVIKLGNEQAWTYLKFGFALQNAGRLGEALAAFQKAREKTSEDLLLEVCDKAITDCQARMRP